MGDSGVTWKPEALASWAPSADLQRQSCWSRRKQLSHPSSCCFPPLGRPQPKKQLCQHNAAGGTGTRAGNEEGCLKRWGNTCGGVVQCLSSLGGFKTISAHALSTITLPLLPISSGGGASGERENKTLSGQLWLLRPISPCWGIISPLMNLQPLDENYRTKACRRQTSTLLLEQALSWRKCSGAWSTQR